MSDIALLLEAERRGILPPERKAALDEARNRGLVPAGIDFNRDEASVRADIAKLPERARERALTDWADQFVKREREAARQTTVGSIGQAAGDVLRNVAGGTLVGSFLDEANAYTQGALNDATGGYLGKPRDEVLAYQRATDRAIQKEFPIVSTVAQIAGGVASAMPLVRGAQTVAGNIGRGAAVGSGYGAVSGFGAGEGNVANRAESAATGAVIGAGIGAAIPAGVAAARGAYQQARDFAMPQVLQRTQGPDAAAEYILARRMGAADTSPAAVRGDLAGGSYSSRFGSNSRAPMPEMIADTSDDMQRLAGTVYRQGGEAGQTIRDALNTRQRGPANPYAPQPGEAAGQADDLMNAASRALQIRTRDSAYRTVNQIQRDQAETGRALYQRAYQSQEPIDIDNVLTGFRLIGQQYQGAFRARLDRAARLFEADNMPVNNIRRFDAAKKSLDDMIETARRQGAGNLSRELTQFKDALLRAVHQYDNQGNPTRHADYWQARQAWASSAESREAVDLGRAALRENSEVTVDQFRALTPAQQELFRVGFLDSLRSAMASKRPGNDITQIFQQRRTTELLREIIPDSRSRRNVFSDRTERFGDYVNRTARMNQTRNAVMGNSATAQRIQDDMRGAGDMLASALQALRGGTSWALEAVAVTLNRMAGYNQEVSTRLARMLTSTDRAEQNRVLNAVRRRMGEQQFRIFSDELSRAVQGASAAGGSMAGRESGAR